MLKADTFFKHTDNGENVRTNVLSLQQHILKWFFRYGIIADVPIHWGWNQTKFSKNGPTSVMTFLKILNLIHDFFRKVPYLVLCPCCKIKKTHGNLDTSSNHSDLHHNFQTCIGPITAGIAQTCKKGLIGLDLFQKLGMTWQPN